MAAPQQISMRVNSDRYKRVSTAAKMKNMTIAQYTEAAWDTALKAAAAKLEFSGAGTDLEKQITRLSERANELMRGEP